VKSIFGDVRSKVWSSKSRCEAFYHGNKYQL